MYLATVFDTTKNAVYQRSFDNLKDAEEYCNIKNLDAEYELAWTINRITSGLIEIYDGEYHDIKHGKIAADEVSYCEYCGDEIQDEVYETSCGAKYCSEYCQTSDIKLYCEYCGEEIQDEVYETSCGTKCCSEYCQMACWKEEDKLIDEAMERYNYAI